MCWDSFFCAKKRKYVKMVFPQCAQTCQELIVGPAVKKKVKSQNNFLPPY